MQSRTAPGTRLRMPEVLNGWKEIARYVQRDVRTVERWEKQRGLPVRRLPGAGRATVFARVTELEEWLASRPLDAESDLVPDSSPESRPEQKPDPVPAERPATGSNLVPFPVPVTSTATPNAVLNMAAVPVTGPASGPDLVSHPSPGPLHTAAHTSTPSQATLQPPLQTAHQAAPVLPPSAPVHVPGAASTGLRWPIAAAACAAFLLVGAVMAAAVLHLRHQPVQTAAQPLRRSAVPGADDLYLRGMYSMEQRTPAGVEDAVRTLTAATERDPHYAPAFSGLATAWLLLREYAVHSDAECYSKARQYAEQAVALDPGLAQAHADLGFVAYFDRLDAAAADREFQTAIRLQPDLPLPHHWFGSALTHQGRLHQALQQLDEAQHLDPTSSPIRVSRAFALGLSGDRKGATDLLEPLLSTDDAHAVRASSTALRVSAILSLQEPREMDRFLAASLRSEQLRHNPAGVERYRAMSAGYARAGADGAWTADLQWYDRHPAPPTLEQAEALFALGRTDEGFVLLERIAGTNPRQLCNLNVNPMLRRVSTDPRYHQLQQHLGLPTT